MAEKKDAKLTLAAQIKAINKKFGKGTMTVASKAVAMNLKRIPSGSLSLDCEMGGGYPEGRITLIAGPRSSGKSYLAYKGVAEAQKKYADKEAVWIDQEGTFDAEWAENFGIDLDRLQVVRPEVAEDALDIALAMMQLPDVSMVVVDSLAAMASAKELENSMSDTEAMGGNAKMNNKFFRKSQGILNMGSIEEEKEQPAIIIINQLRAGMDKYNPEVLPGGMGQEFFTSIIIKVRRGDKYMEKDAGGKEVYVGHQLKFKTEKNKTFAPMRSGIFDIYVMESRKGFKAGEIDHLKEIAAYAKYYGIIQQNGSYYKVLGNDDWNLQGIDKVLDFLELNPEIRKVVEEKTLKAALEGAPPAGKKKEKEELTLVTENGEEVDPETGEILSEGNEA